MTVLREAVAAARSQAVASILTVLMLIGMVTAVLLTTGRTVGTEQRVLGSIDSAGTRAITVRANDDAGVTTAVLGRIASIEGIEWAGAFSRAVDGTNARIAGGPLVAVRRVFTASPAVLGVPRSIPLAGRAAYASPAALVQLGMPEGSGGIRTTEGDDLAVMGPLRLPGFLDDLEPAVLQPVPDPDGSESVALLVVVSDDPARVAAVGDAVQSVLAPVDPSGVTVSTSERLAELRSLIRSQLGGFSRGLVLAVLALTAALVAVILFGLVLLRRKDYGRRRALGATRGFVVGLLLAQTGVLALVGVAAGTVLALAVLAGSGDPLPGPSFVAAVAVLGIVTALVAGIAPAVVASRRDPITELRVP